MRFHRDNSYVRVHRRTGASGLTKPWRMVVVLAVLMVAGYLFIGGDRGLLKYMEMRRQAAYLQAEIDRLSQENQEIEAQVKRIKPGSAEWERLVRTVPLLVRPDDVIYRLVEK